MVGETKSPSGKSKGFSLRAVLVRYVGTGIHQIFFAVIFVLLLPCLWEFLQRYNELVESRKKGNPEYPWPEYSDLWLCVYSCSFLITINILLKKMFLPMARVIVHPKHKEWDKEERAKRMIDSLVKATYFVFSSIYGYIVAKDSFFLPPELGGSGSVQNMFYGLPYQPIDTFPLVRNYLMIQMGYHLHSFVLLFTHKPRSDFMEMLLHHVITLSMIGLAYFMNYTTPSVLILFSHDISDALVHMTRVVADTTYMKIGIPIYFLLMASWAYTRLWILPSQIIYYSCYNNPMFDQISGVYMLGGMAHILLILHIYWGYLLVRMGFSYIRNNEIKDIQSQTKSEDSGTIK